MAINALVVGAGKIGAFFDSPKCEDILTHAHAYIKHDYFNLVGFVDITAELAGKAAQQWGGEAFTSIQDAFEKFHIDVVSICVPDEYHYSTIMQVLDYPVRLIFAEKPLAKTMNEAKKLLNYCKSKDVPLLLNYSRRFSLKIEHIINAYKSGEYGRYLTGNGFYGKGVLHNGTHMLDLLRALLGEITSTQEISRVYDFYETDPSISAVLGFEDQSQFVLQSINCSKFTIFEADFMFERARVKLLNSGFNIELYNVNDSDRFAGYKNLSLKNSEKTDLEYAMFNAVENIYRFFSKGEKLKCTHIDGVQAMKIALGMIDGEKI